MRFSLLLFAACGLFGYSSAAPQQNFAKLSAEESWEAIKAGVTQIYRQEVGLTVPQYMNLLGLVHSYCTKTSDKVSVGKQGGTKLIGDELYEKLTNYLEDHLVEIFGQRKNLDNEELLTFYTNKWAEYRFSSKVINHVFSYLNRHWVRREIAEGHKDVYEVFQLTLVKWRDHMLKHELNTKLSTAVLRLIERERNGDMVNTNTIRGFIDCFAELGMDDIAFYKDNFEHPFIQETEHFYTTESVNYFIEHSIVDYMKHIEKRFDEEMKRVQVYLHSSTEAILMKTCERVMIEKHVDTIRAEFGGLLEKQQFDDLRRMHSLVSRVPGGMSGLYNLMEKQVHKEGVAKIVLIGREAVAEPNLFVDAVIKVHQTYFGVVKDALKMEPGFVTAMDNACVKFINSNEITKITKSAKKIPELLAKYADNLLRGKNTEDDEINRKLNEIITVFKYIDDKDVFQKFYSRFLAKRLINELSSSEEHEAMMLSKLKEICGNEYTTKLERMFTDLKLSNDLNADFREHRSADDKKSYDLSVKVLSTGSWPISAQQNVELILPNELAKGTQEFTDFFVKKHSGRKLHWMYNMGKGEMVTSHLKKKYTVICSAYQMAILLQFNYADSLTVDQLSIGTGMDEDYLVQVLQPMLKSKLFKSTDAANKLNMDSVIELNMDFKYGKPRLNLNVPIKTEEKKEQSDAEKQIEDDRAMLIQSTIVRIMKARKTLDHQSLMIEAVEQLKSRFKPDITLIKKQIGILIEKKYMQRKEGEKDTYEYIA